MHRIHARRSNFFQARRRLPVGLALTLVLAAPMAAWSQSTSTATATLSPQAVRLVDLNPGDALAPAITLLRTETAFGGFLEHNAPDGRGFQSLPGSVGLSWAPAARRAALSYSESQLPLSGDGTYTGSTLAGSGRAWPPPALQPRPVGTLPSGGSTAPLRSVLPRLARGGPSETPTSSRRRTRGPCFPRWQPVMSRSKAVVGACRLPVAHSGGSQIRTESRSSPRCLSWSRTLGIRLPRRTDCRSAP